MKRSTLDRAVHALRTTTAPQIKGMPSDEDGGRCALGVIAEELGWDAAPYNIDNWAEALNVTMAAGIPYRIAPMNDGWITEGGAVGGRRYTFAEIADWLEANATVTDEDVVPAAWVAEVEAAEVAT